ELAALDRKVDLGERVHLGRACVVDLGHAAQFECGSHCETSIVRVDSSGASTAWVGAFDGSCLRRASAASSQRTIPSSRKSSASATSASATSSSRADALIWV